MKNFKKKKMNVIVCGCGRFGACLASSLSSQKYDVVIIDKQPRAFHKLSDDFGGFEIIGDASDLDTLEAAGIKQCDMILVTTDDDNVNSMIAQIASSIYNIRDVYIRLTDPDKEKLLTDVQIHAIYPALLSVKEFEEVSSLHILQEVHV